MTHLPLKWWENNALLFGFEGTKCLIVLWPFCSGGPVLWFQFCSYISWPGNYISCPGLKASCNAHRDPGCCSQGLKRKSVAVRIQAMLSLFSLQKHYLFGGNPGKDSLPKMRLDDFWSLQVTVPFCTFRSGSSLQNVGMVRAAAAGQVAATEFTWCSLSVHFFISTQRGIFYNYSNGHLGCLTEIGPKELQILCTYIF